MFVLCVILERARQRKGKKKRREAREGEREKDNIQRFVGVSLRWYVNS